MHLYVNIEGAASWPTKSTRFLEEKGKKKDCPFKQRRWVKQISFNYSVVGSNKVLLISNTTGQGPELLPSIRETLSPISNATEKGEREALTLH